jgi:hypothetical protein
MRWRTAKLSGLILLVCVSSYIAAQPTTCDVTKPNGSPPPGQQVNADYYGNGELWTTLPPNGTVVFRPGGPGIVRPDGSSSMKFPWWRGVEGKLIIEGERLDAASPPLDADVPEGYGEIGFQATALIFRTPGCWQVTGRVGGTSLTFAVKVVHLR